MIISEGGGEQRGAGRRKGGGGQQRLLSLKISPEKVMMINYPISLYNLIPTLVILDEQMRTSLLRATASTLPNPASSTNNPGPTVSHLSTVPSVISDIAPLHRKISLVVSTGC